MNVSIDHPTNRPNFTEVVIGELTIWFSYRTPIAFRVGYGPLVARENEWGPTTGKHFGYLGVGPKVGRLSGVAFEQELAKVVSGLVAA